VYCPKLPAAFNFIVGVTCASTPNSAPKCFLSIPDKISCTNAVLSPPIPSAKKNDISVAS
jgi:hypothetical protein